MYMNNHGNVLALCIISSKPQYREEVGERKTELTKVYAKANEATPDGMQTVNLNLLFYGGLAIPAMKISPGMTLLVAGRVQSQERFERGKNVLERSLYVVWWDARDIDPLGVLEELKVRRETKTREQELKLAFWDFLNLPQIKELLFKWFMEFVEDYKAKKQQIAEKEDEKQ